MPRAVNPERNPALRQARAKMGSEVRRADSVHHYTHIDAPAGRLQKACDDFIPQSPLFKNINLQIQGFFCSLDSPQKVSVISPPRKYIFSFSQRGFPAEWGEFEVVWTVLFTEDPMALNFIN